MILMPCLRVVLEKVFFLHCHQVAKGDLFHEKVSLIGIVCSEFTARWLWWMVSSTLVVGSYIFYYTYHFCILGMDDEVMGDGMAVAYFIWMTFHFNEFFFFIHTFFFRFCIFFGKSDRTDCHCQTRRLLVIDLAFEVLEVKELR